MMIEHNSCAAVDEYGHEISCSECINDGRCRACSGVPREECARYEPERSYR